MSELVQASVYFLWRGEGRRAVGYWVVPKVAAFATDVQIASDIKAAVQDFRTYYEGSPGYGGLQAVCYCGFCLLGHLAFPLLKWMRSTDPRKKERLMWDAEPVFAMPEGKGVIHE